MGKIKRELTTFLNETFIPFGLKISRSAMLLEFYREYVEFLNNDMVYSHPYVRCACGSDKVFNYGIPKNNGRYFYCRMCETSFKEPVYQREWNKTYSICGTENPTNDFWLEKYDHLLRESRELPIIDLGAGYGNDTIYLKQQGFNTVSCDYSEEALRRLKRLVGTTPTMCFNMLDGLPFLSNTLKTIVANLSLHYFAWYDTERIIEEINRVLVKDGCLLCRVKSIGDKEKGASQGTPIEENYYDFDGKLKRFFDEKQLKNLFRGWNTLHRFEHSIIRFGKTKIFWEVVVRNR
ncbi:MAG: class I SAM-dependent methyltransferase [Deltaproteobacteria bacterium]|nr:class I SAM-dependent methyltransferase [Deltaproteobacteria bacterium]